MRLPEILKCAIEAKIARSSVQQLLLSSKKLSNSYRANKISHPPFMSSEEDYLAYLTVRLPATYGAIFHVLSVVQEKISSIDTCLDVGAGPGTAFWAALEIFNLKFATLVEKEKGLIALGKSFTDQLNLIKCEWVQKDLEKECLFEPHDLTIMSYGLGELSETSREPLLQKMWQASKKVMILIEPGTPMGFKRIMEARQRLISWGAHVLAPCPHQNQCPLSGTDWCHFSERIERSSLHRQVKQAELNYEDEKFSYVVCSKESFLTEGSRIIRHPQKHSGHVEFKLCSSSGIKSKTISRKQKDIYRLVRKLKWGSLLNLNNPSL